MRMHDTRYEFAPTRIHPLPNNPPHLPGLQILWDSESRSQVSEGCPWSKSQNFSPSHYNRLSNRKIEWKKLHRKCLTQPIILVPPSQPSSLNPHFSLTEPQPRQVINNAAAASLRPADFVGSGDTSLRQPHLSTECRKLAARSASMPSRR